MVKETLPQLNPAMLEIGENVLAVTNLASLITTYHGTLVDLSNQYNGKAGGMALELIAELTRDFASNLHQKAAGF